MFPIEQPQRVAAENRLLSARRQIVASSDYLDRVWPATHGICVGIIGADDPVTLPIAFDQNTEQSPSVVWQK